MIQFIESKGGYRERTAENAMLATITLAIAKDFNTAGEILTKRSVIKHHNLYCPLDIPNHLSLVEIPGQQLDDILTIKPTSINIAGNGIYTLAKYRIDQEYIDQVVYLYMAQLVQELKAECQTHINIIRSGGQTGVDEAGLKAAVKLKIAAICIAPKGWLFRDVNGIDISDEALFKQRFK